MFYIESTSYCSKDRNANYNGLILLYCYDYLGCCYLCLLAVLNKEKKTYIKIHLFECVSAQLTLGAWSNNTLKTIKSTCPISFWRVCIFFFNMYPFFFCPLFVYSLCVFAVAHDYTYAIKLCAQFCLHVNGKHCPIRYYLILICFQYVLLYREHSLQSHLSNRNHKYFVWHMRMAKTARMLEIYNLMCLYTFVMYVRVCLRFIWHSRSPVCFPVEMTISAASTR